MQFSVLGDNFVKAITTMSRFVGNGRTLPVLGNILLEAEGSRLKLVATNLEIGASMYMGARVDRPGAITLPSKMLVELIKKYGKGQRIDITVNDKTHTASIKSGRFSSELKGITAEDFPDIGRKADIPLIFTIEGREMKRIVNIVGNAAATEDNRPILTGIHIKREGVIAATDGYRLHVASLQGEIEDSMVSMTLPAGAMKSIARDMDDRDTVQVYYEGARGNVVFETAVMTWTARTLEGKFPDFAAMIPRSDIVCIQMESSEFAKALDAATVFAREDANKILLGFNVVEQIVTIHAESPERGSFSADIVAKIDGDGVIDVGVNVRYMMEAVSSLNSNLVQIKMSGKQSPILVIDPSVDNVKMIVMPMMVNR